jgi:hypothetical protein
MLNNILFPDVTQLMSHQILLNLEDHYTLEDRGRMPNILQQVFADISNTSCSADLQSEINVVGTEGHGSQQPDSGQHAAEGGNGFRCIQCGKVYMRKGTLTRHLKFECGKEPQFQCPLCPLRTKHKSSLLTHIYCKHRGWNITSEPQWAVQIQL